MHIRAIAECTLLGDCLGPMCAQNFRRNAQRVLKLQFSTLDQCSWLSFLLSHCFHLIFFYFPVASPTNEKSKLQHTTQSHRNTRFPMKNQNAAAFSATAFVAGGSSQQPQTGLRSASPTYSELQPAAISNTSSAPSNQRLLQL